MFLHLIRRNSSQFFVNCSSHASSTNIFWNSRTKKQVNKNQTKLKQNTISGLKIKRKRLLQPDDLRGLILKRNRSGFVKWYWNLKPQGWRDTGAHKKFLWSPQLTNWLPKTATTTRGNETLNSHLNQTFLLVTAFSKIQLCFTICFCYIRWNKGTVHRKLQRCLQ